MKVERSLLHLQLLKETSAGFANFVNIPVIGKTEATITNNEMIQQLNLHGTAEHKKILREFNVLQ